MRFVSAFAGIGGMDLGFEQAGWKCVGQVELDKHARSVLERHWPDVPKHDDVTTAKEWADECGLVGRVDVVCGGFPCQPFSVAGKRLGRDDLRGNLFWNALEFTSHVGAPILILENVPGLLTSDKGGTFGEIVSDLAEAGFHHIEWRVLDSQNFGVPQRRRRVFIVACRDPSIFGGREVLTEREGMRWHPPQGRQAGADPAGTTAGGFAGRSVVAALTANGLGGGGPDDNLAQAGHLVAPLAFGMTQFAGYSEGVTTLNAFDSGDTRATVAVLSPTVRRLTPVECERLQGFPDDHTAGQADSHRYKQCGNAVSVPVANYVACLVNMAVRGDDGSGTV